MSLGQFFPTMCLLFGSSQEHFDEVSSFYFAVADAAFLNKYQEMTGDNWEIHLAIHMNTM